jgi:ATP-binding cassette, subfamily F, member 3
VIILRDIAIQFGGETLFENISLTIGTRDRIGLVGSNGAGKTTLLRIMHGDVEPDRGSVQKAKAATVGFLPQEIVRMRERSLYDEVATAFGDILETQDALAVVQNELMRADLAESERNELIERMGSLQHHLEMSDAFRMKSSIEKVLMGLGFREEQFGWSTGQFSGGWVMRIELAKLLLRQPSLLLLDEPTNHLDLVSLRWLEEYLKSYEGSLIIVSHDRTFLDTMCSTIWELSLGKLTIYTGNFSHYVVEKDQRRELLDAAYRNQQRQIKQTERFIERFRYKATKARQVQSRVKQLEKIERIELEDEESEITFRFPPPPRSGSVVMKLTGIRKSYGDVRVFNGIDFTVERGDRIAFVGINGAGKSTLAKIIAGVERETGGHREPGYNVSIGYFAQNQAEELDGASTPLDLLTGYADGEMRMHVRTLLGCFLFQGDDVFKPVRVLSGGEKSRLALAKMLVTPANLLILDEPTNHLDMRSKDILRRALADFQGSYILVSHDRAFMKDIVNKVIEFRHGGTLKEYIGTLDEYLARTENERDGIPAANRSQGNEGKRTDKERKRREAELRQQRFNETKPLSKELEKTEREIHELEEIVAGLEKKLMDEELYSKPDEIREINHEYTEAKERLGELYRTWERLSTELDRINRKYDGLFNGV